MFAVSITTCGGSCIEGLPSQSQRDCIDGLRPQLPTSGHDDRGTLQFDELAFWLLDCNSFTTCLTLGTEEAICSACARTELDLTSPVRVTTPFLTSYFTFLCSPFWMRAASKFFSMPVSRSEFIALTALSPPGGITAI